MRFRRGASGTEGGGCHYDTLFHTQTTHNAHESHTVSPFSSKRTPLAVGADPSCS